MIRHFVSLSFVPRARLVAVASVLSSVVVACSGPAPGTDGAADTVNASETGSDATSMDVARDVTDRDAPPQDVVRTDTATDTVDPDTITVDSGPVDAALDDVGDAMPPDDAEADVAFDGITPDEGPDGTTSDDVLDAVVPDDATDATPPDDATDAAPPDDSTDAIDTVDAADDVVTPLDVVADAPTMDAIDDSSAPDAGDDTAPVDVAMDIPVANRPPVVTSCVIQRADHLPLPARTNDPLEAVATTTDADGDAVTVAYAWTVGTNNAGSGSMLAPTAFVRGESVSVTCIATDSHGDASAPVTSAPITIANSAPTITSATIRPSLPTRADSMVAIPAGYADADGDRGTYSYRWTINGVDVPDSRSGNLASLPGFAAFRGDTVYVRITPFDGTSAGNVVTSPVVTLVNAPPSAPAIRASAGTGGVDEDTDIHCTFDMGSTDADLDTITYDVEWWRFRPANPFSAPDGAGTLTRVLLYSNVTSTTGTQNTYGSPLTQFGDRVFCRVTPSDGFTRGPTVDSNAVAVYSAGDVIPPSLEAIDRYRNDSSVHLRGACDSSCTSMRYDCTSSTGAHIASSSPMPSCISSRYDIAVTLPVETWTCTTWCIDSSSSSSLHAWSQTTERCATGESYETPGDAAGDTLAAAINADLSIWSPLADAPPSMVTISGNILGAGLEATDRVDWYRFRATDLDQGTMDAFHFDVALTAGASDYDVLVVREDGSTVPMQPHPAVPGSDTYSWTPADALVTCPTGAPGVDSCVDYSADFWVRVTRPSGTGCGGYTLRVRNGM